MSCLWHNWCWRCVSRFLSRSTGFCHEMSQRVRRPMAWHILSAIYWKLDDNDKCKNKNDNDNNNDNNSNNNNNSNDDNDVIYVTSSPVWWKGFFGGWFAGSPGLLMAGWSKLPPTSGWPLCWVSTSCFVNPEPMSKLKCIESWVYIHIRVYINIYLHIKSTYIVWSLVKFEICFCGFYKGFSHFETKSTWRPSATRGWCISRWLGHLNY